MRIFAPTYTQTPNDLFDHWLPLLNEGELKVLLVIMRKTFGWHKTHDVISASQLSKYTGMLEETVIKAARSLQGKGIINREVVGENGKQQTIYSLVISEDSNNSYPSVHTPPVKPIGPLGLNPPVQTEAQKKASLKENIQKKQQQAVAVFPSSEKVEQQQKQPYECLAYVMIPEEDKIEITGRYPEDVVKKGVAWLDHPSTKITKSPAAALKWACQNKMEPPPKKEDYEGVNKAYAYRYDGKQNSYANICACSKHIEIIYTTCQKQPLCFEYESKGFIEEFKNALLKNGFEVIT